MWVLLPLAMTISLESSVNLVFFMINNFCSDRFFLTWKPVASICWKTKKSKLYQYMHLSLHLFMQFPSPQGYLFHKISYWFLGWLWKGFCCIALWTAYQNNIVYSSYHPVHVLVPSADFACCSESQLQKVIAEVGAERKHITAVLQAVHTLILQ